MVISDGIVSQGGGIVRFPVLTRKNLRLRRPAISPLSTTLRELRPAQPPRAPPPSTLTTSDRSLDSIAVLPWRVNSRFNWNLGFSRAAPDQFDRALSSSLPCSSPGHQNRWKTHRAGWTRASSSLEQAENSRNFCNIL